MEDILSANKIPASEVMANRNEAERRVRNLGFSPDLTNAVVEISRILVDENLIPDSKKLEAIRKQARRLAEPAYIREGEIIVRSGEVVTIEDLRIIQELGLLGRGTGWLSLLGIVVFVSLAGAFVAIYAAKYYPSLSENTSELVLYSLVMVLTIGLTQLIAIILPASSTGGSGFLVPVAFAALLIGVLIDTRIAVISAVVLSAVVGLVFRGRYEFALVGLVGGVTGALSISRHSDRSGLMRSGFIVAAVQMLAVSSIYMMTSNFNLVFAVIQAGITGMMSAVLTIGSLPFLENLFGVTSSIGF